MTAPTLPVCALCGSGELVTVRDGQPVCWNTANCQARQAAKAGTR